MCWTSLLLLVVVDVCLAVLLPFHLRLLDVPRKVLYVVLSALTWKTGGLVLVYSIMNFVRASSMSISRFRVEELRGVDFDVLYLR